jgi:catalase
LAFPLMHRGLEQEAEPLYVSAVEGARVVGDAMLQARFLSYYAVLHRRLGRTHAASTMAREAGAIAEKGAMFDYVGVSEANLCWASWRDGDDQELRRHADATFAAWAKLPKEYPYPCQWFVRAPLAAHLFSQGRFDESLEHWVFLLRPEQQLLAAALQDAIRSAEHSRAQCQESAHIDILHIIEVAKEHRYL